MDERERALERLRNDDYSVEREVTYWFYFDEKENMDRLIVAALGLNYTVCSAAQDEKTKQWGLILSLTHDVESDTLERMFELHDRLAKRFGSQYDGHEYQIGPLEDEEPRDP